MQARHRVRAATSPQVLGPAVLHFVCELDYMPEPQAM